MLDVDLRRRHQIYGRGGGAKTRKRSKNEHGLRCVLLLISHQHKQS